jgi:hypothetical protein
MNRFVRRSLTVTAFGCLTLSAAAALAQAPSPAPAPQTFWNWMGVPKHPLAGCINRGGNFPECEKKPPLKAIADPANLQSDNPAIKKAAEIKAQEDLAAQKIKALKYLATIGCGGCYEGVDKAIAAALEDCTEAVRYEAVKTILAASACGQNDCVKKCVRKSKTCKEAMCDCWVGCMKNTCATMHLLCGKPGPDGVTLKSKCPGYGCGAGGQCQPGRCACGDGNCCTSEILNKLSTMAFEKDDRGCWKEPSPRVRAMARQALRACGPNIRPYTEAVMPVPEEVPATPDAAPVVPKNEKKETSDEKKEVNYEPAFEGESETASVETLDESGADAIDENNRIVSTPIMAGEAAEVTQDSDPAVDTGADGDAGADSVADVTTLVDTELEAPLAPSPDDLFQEPDVQRNARPIVPVAPKPVRTRPLARLGAVLPTAGALMGSRPVTQ